MLLHPILSLFSFVIMTKYDRRDRFSLFSPLFFVSFFPVGIPRAFFWGDLCSFFFFFLLFLGQGEREEGGRGKGEGELSRSILSAPVYLC